MLARGQSHSHQRLDFWQCLEGVAHIKGPDEPTRAGLLEGKAIGASVSSRRQQVQAKNLCVCVYLSSPREISFGTARFLNHAEKGNVAFEESEEDGCMQVRVRTIFIILRWIKYDFF